jgi:threonine dehydratase
MAEHVVAEPAGAAASAAFLKSPQDDGRTVALLVTGANLSAETLKRVVNVL